MKIKIITLLFIALALVGFSAGCSYRSYTEGGTKYTSFAFGTSQTVAAFTLEAGKKDDPSYRKLESKGLTNDPSASAIEAATKGAVQGAMSFAK